MDELSAMRRAVELSARALGTTSPNPPVGAVLLGADGAVVGEGWTQPPGGAHAEVGALREAGARARGATAVVTLEPCAHTGRTGPCARALLEAGVRRVVVACEEPTQTAGGGARLLREAGIDVEVGVLAQEVSRGPLQAWLGSRRTGRPFVTWKFAATLDGRSAAADGSSRWITGEASRADVHALRAQADAVLAGVGTVLADDPLLDVRPDPGHQPLRVVLDSRGRTPASARLLAGPEPALVITGLEVAPNGVRRHARATVHGQHLNLREVLQLLQEDHQVVSALLEGGPTLAAAFLRQGLVDRIVAYVAPALLGDGAAAVGPLGVSSIDAALRFGLQDVTLVGDDVRLTLLPSRSELTSSAGSATRSPRNTSQDGRS